MSRWERIRRCVEISIEILVPVSMAALAAGFVIFLELVAEAVLEGRIR